MPNKKRKSSSSKKAAPVNEPTKVRFDFIKSNLHREIFVEGATGGATPHGKLQMSLFLERSVIPQQVVYKMSSDGELRDEIKEERVSREAVIRIIETTLIMDISTAKAIHKWMGTHINELERLLKEANK
ncbi:hypothetical protein JXA32_03485 [Candidatus Sumerlaeota bacterium]|nr:hypothetical protein [Candidatus Sumerlaeota bacterium]